MIDANSPLRTGESLHHYLEEHESVKAGLAVAIIWTVTDVLLLENPETGEPYGLTEEEALEVLSAVRSDHDANYGISWSTIHDSIDNCLRARTTTEEPASA